MFLIVDREMQKIMNSLPQERASRFVVGAVMFALGVLALGIAGGYAVPADLFSTALWFDNQGMPLVFGIKFYLWDLLGDGRSTSIEGAVFSILITLFTWILSFKTMRAVAQANGNYGGGSRNPISLLWSVARGTIRTNDINWDILAPMAEMWALVLFDVFTGTGFRAGGNAGIATSFLVAFLFENVLSDNALIAGFQMAITGGMVLYQMWDGRGTAAPRPVAVQPQQQVRRAEPAPSQAEPRGGQSQHRQPQQRSANGAFASIPRIEEADDE